ncbi:MAG: undecaprenyl-diphosphate phosphatase [Methyloversatilis sp.]|uniref:undecaprenyl-diphosphate phosphatase n=1 Tax=Methyloversatilis sp. TaxID=2569862 RepID=UPI00273651DC|nr:undecaprenyl-diphosphate phosphatase [Methyloversatilis sp.]MDP3871913.1 undecaprenyl-diphosphate phosphatase [Methyloversatilis sp.]
MDPLLIKAFILGIIEGLTEFLPISSTGHLIIAGSLLGYTDDTSRVFKIVIQLAAILAICWEYRRKLIDVGSGVLARDPQANHFVTLVLIAFMPAAVLGFLLHGVIKAYLFNPLTVAGALIVGGVLILLIERRNHQPRYETVEEMDWRAALKVGFAQSVAMFPGVSRSGATIMGGLIFGLSRRAATEFSFFLAIPTMFAATAYDVYKNWALLRADDLPVFATGFVASFLAAFFSVRWLLRYISTHTFEVFAWYRIAFGIIVLLTAAGGWVDWADH